MNSYDINLIREAISYCPETGVFTWTARRFGVTSGTEAGTDHKGYKRIRLFGKLFLAHRLAWAIHYGEWPKNEIDHINMNKSDNRIDNLRHVTHSGQMINRKYPKGASGVTGVSKNRYGWQAAIRVNCKTVFLGLFKTIEEAAAVRLAAQNEIYGSLSPKGDSNE
jgi:hypothetical protein